MEYNFTGQRAKIVGTKITGDPFVPAGVVCCGTVCRYAEIDQNAGAT